jgi:hypothetical protein
MFAGPYYRQESLALDAELLPDIVTGSSQCRLLGAVGDMA